MKIAIVLLIALASSPTYAYLDPVSGSFLVQGLIATVLAIVAGARSIRDRLLKLLGYRKDDD